MMSPPEPILLLDANIYSLAAIKRALYDFADTGPLDVATDGAKYTIFSIARKELPDSCHEKFLACVIEHEIRLELEAKYDKIRQVIVEQAIRPIDNETLAAKIAALHGDS